MVIIRLCRIIHGARLIRYGCRFLQRKIIVKRSCQAYGLWEYRCNARSRYAVQRFVPPVIGRDIEPWNSRGCVHHLVDLFIQRKPRYQVFYPCI